MEVLEGRRLFGGLGKAVDDNFRDLVKWLDVEVSNLLPTAGFRVVPQGAFRPGDAVHVWSNSTQRWILDGVVREVTTSAVRVDAHQTLPAGSVRVVFKGGTGNKWVLPQQIPDILRAAHGGEQKAVRQIPTPQKPAARAGAACAARQQPPPPGPPQPAPCGSDDVSLAKLWEVEAKLQPEGRLFEDREFRPQLQGKIKRWRRPQEVTAQAGRALGGWAYELFGISTPADWRLFRGEPRADDVQQGELGDCWLISSLSALAEFQGGCYVRALLPGQERVSPCGAYLVRLCLGGRWRGILIDDRLPCLEDAKSAFCVQLAYCEAHRLQLWASIVEKGLAKACGSYAALHRGQASEALSILTGWPCTQISFERPDFDAGILWATLISSKQAGFLLTCGTYQVKKPLQPYHIYTLMDLFEVEVGQKGHVKVVKIRNPHAKSKWEGAWSDASELWTPALRQQLGCPEGGTPGVFFMSFGDFLQNFRHCTICRIRSNEWHEVRRPLRLRPHGPPTGGLVLKAAETAECCVTLAQPEERLRRGPLYKGHSLPLASIGFVLLEMPSSSSERPSVVAVAQLRQRALVSVDCWLKAGQSYALVPLGDRANAPIEASLAFFTSRPLELAEERSASQLGAPVLSAAARAAQGPRAAQAPGFHPAVRGPHFKGGLASDNAEVPDIHEERDLQAPSCDLTAIMRRLPQQFGAW